MSRLRDICALLPLLALPTVALADGEVSGVLFEKGSGTPAAGVSITADGQSDSTTTDADGAFMLALPAGTWTLRLSGAQSGEAAGVVVVDDQTTELLVTVANGTVQSVQMEAPAALQAASTPTDAADATVQGVVLDDDGSPIAGARIFVRGAAVEAQTDAEGRFSVPVPVGTHTLSILHARYATQTVSDVAATVEGGTPVEVRLVPAGLELDAYVVLAPAIDGGTATLLAERQDTSDVVDTVSAEEMTRRGDSSAASALKRVTGLTVVGGKYIYVRGMGERYSATLLNGSSRCALERGANPHAAVASPHPTRSHHSRPRAFEFSRREDNYYLTDVYAKKLGRAVEASLKPKGDDEGHGVKAMV